MGYLRLSLIFTILTVWPATAHEFWIEPEQYQVERDDPLVATLRNGQNFKGVSLSYFENKFTRFEIHNDVQVVQVEGRMGDAPALQTQAAFEGLNIVVHETTPSTLKYSEWEKFLNFVEHKDFREAVASHEEMGWPKEGFRESYTRHAKALIAVGDGAGSDKAMGLQTEFVALTNPYSPDFDGMMRVQLNGESNARADAQVEVFAKAPDGTVDVSLHRTDSKGQAAIAVQPGYEYLFDAVILRPSAQAGSSETAPVWETLWAALTFYVPDR